MNFRASLIACFGVAIVGLMSIQSSHASDANANNKKPPSRVYFLPGFKVLITPKPAPAPPKYPVDDVVIVRAVPLW
ncbi:MAG: hypothetical protein RLZZ33_853 [Pseudomonadota bacterium]|jgi:hypothetical protein